MDRSELPKLKKAVIALKKLDLVHEVPVTESGNAGKKESVNVLEDSQDPSSESISTGSAESNTLCTDDDDLEKKIQAFSIPVKKDEKPSTKNENEIVKIGGDKSFGTGKRKESTKPQKKVTFDLSKGDIKVEEKGAPKTVIDSPTERSNDSLPERESTNRGTKKKSIVKSKLKTSKEEKQFSPGNKSLTAKPQKTHATDKCEPSDLKNTNDKSPLQRSLRNGRDDKNIEKGNERKSRKDKRESIMEESMGSPEGARKRKIQKEEIVPVPPKKTLIEKKSSKSSTDLAPPAQVEKKSYKTNEVTLKSEANKKSMSKNSTKISDDNVEIKRSARISNAANASKTDERKSKDTKSHESKNREKIIVSKKNLDNQQSSKLAVKKKLPKDKENHENSSESKKDINIPKVKEKLKKKIKDKVPEKKVNGVPKKRFSLDTLIPKEEYATALQNVTAFGRESKMSVSPALPEKVNKPNAKVHKLQAKSDGGNKSVQKSNSDISDDGEELLEKICDILEDSSGPEFSEKKSNTSQIQYPSSQKIIIPTKEIIFIPDPSILKPIFHKNAKFPPHCKGTVSYKKLWKWSHYVRMPSDMWSLYKHPDGNFVIVFHISESSSFPKLLIDKCIIFKETASPSVKIYGKDITALSSENEIQTLGNVCAFLKHINNISLCEGRLASLEGEGNLNCELYTEETVLLPYKCKSCL